MMFTDDFRAYIDRHDIVHVGDRLLLGVSGGIDSMVMLDVFCRLHDSLGVDIAVAHCNFSLRGSESDGDQMLVEQICADRGVRCHTVRFDTHAAAAEYDESIQMAARRLRYDWFAELCSEHGYNRIAIAHHADDSTETFFINLMRGTGLRGLTGIADRRGMVIRPLLFADRDRITDYATGADVAYRNDSTNKEVKYLRNRLRHEIIPLLSSSSNSFGRTMEGNLFRLTQTQRFVDMQIDAVRARALNDNVLDLALLDADFLDFELFEILHPYGFGAEVIADLSKAIGTGLSGKQFMAPRHVALLDRGRVIISDRESVAFVEEDMEIDDPRIEWLDMDDLPNSLATPPRVALLCADSLKFPLRLRRWAVGDWFIPLGMIGQKKVSDFLIDNKVPMTDKETQAVLTSGDTIVWLVGQRIDERYKVTQRASRVVRITL